MIHGGFYGFSRLLVFLQASAYNQKSTVLRHFLAATGKYGLPSRVRVDHGGEELMVLLQDGAEELLLEALMCGLTHGMGQLTYIMICFISWRSILNLTNNSILHVVLMI